VKLDFPRTGTGIRYRKLVISNGKLVGALLLGQRKEGVRLRALQLKRIIEIGADVSGVADGLLDPGFDLAGWLEAQEATLAPEPMREVLPPSASSAIPSNSELMRGSRAMAAPVLPAPPQTAPTEAALVQPNGERFRLGAVTRIGRHPDNDLVLTDDYVSGHHAEIRQEVLTFMLADAGSRNGTFVNEVYINDPTPLRDGDVVRVGQTNLRVSIPAPQAVPASAFGLQAPQAAPAPPSLGAVLPPSAVMGYLQRNGTRWDLKGQVVNLGRDPRSDVALDDPAVSFTHAQITRMGNVLYLRDVGSRNGTYVNY
jgi:pSer/pThr/pTyr-binding forkhead associated (FHA) protein